MVSPTVRKHCVGTWNWIGTLRLGTRYWELGTGTGNSLWCLSPWVHWLRSPQPPGPRPKGTESTGTLHTALCNPASQPSQPSPAQPSPACSVHGPPDPAWALEYSNPALCKPASQQILGKPAPEFAASALLFYRKRRHLSPFKQQGPQPSYI